MLEWPRPSHQERPHGHGQTTVQIVYSGTRPAVSLAGIPAPKDVRARAETFKDVQTEADLVAEPAEETEPARLVEFHGYRDPRFVPKVMLRCALYRLQHPARPLRCHLIIYLDREFESARVDDGGSFQPAIHYLPDLLRQVTIQYPDSPLLSVLRPLVAESDQALIAAAGRTRKESVKPLR